MAVGVKKEIDLDKVREYAGRGLTQEQIAASLGISDRTIRNRLNDDAEFSAAYKEGQAQGIQEIANALFENATKGNVTAQIFFLKARAQWKDRHEEAFEDAPAPERVQVDVVDGDADPQ